MDGKFRTPQKSGLPMAERRHLDVLSEPVGFLGQRRIAKLASKEAEQSLKVVTVARNQAVERIVLADVAVNELAVVGTILAQGQIVASTLVENLSAETGAAKIRLRTLGEAARLSHVKARSEAYSLVRAMQQKGELSEAEAEALNSRSDADLANEVECTDARIAKANAVVEDLFETTLESLKRPFDPNR